MMTQGYGQPANPCTAISPWVTRSGPVDLGCESYDQADEACTSCLNQQNLLNAQVALDRPYMWTHRIVPGIVFGVVFGFYVGRWMK